MSERASDVAVVRAAIRDYNRDLVLRAVAALVLGTLTTAAIMLGVYFVVLIALEAWPFRHVAAPIASGIAFLVMLVLGMQGEDPFRGLRPLKQDEMIRLVLPSVADEFAGHGSEHFRAAWHSIFQHGPMCVAEGLAVWRSRLPAGAAMVEGCGSIVRGLRERGPVPAEAVDQRAAGVLQRAGLVRIEVRGDGGARLALSAKAEEALGLTRVC